MVPSIDRCPASARARIESAFVRACKKHLGQVPQRGTYHSRSVNLLWRRAGGRLGNALAGMEPVVREAAERGFSAMVLGDVVCRMEA